MNYKRASFLYIVPPDTNIASLLTPIIAELLNIPNQSNDKELVEKQLHPQVRWISPEKRFYKKSELEALLAETKQQQLKPLIFVITNAELLQDQAANSLLKILEEPPHNSIFILTTSNEQQILPTIRSRLTSHELDSENSSRETSPLFDLFTTLPIKSFVELHNLLNKQEIDDIQSLKTLDTLIAYWHQQDKNQEPNAKKMLKILLYFAQKPPMPGSSKLFWRTIYMSIKTPAQKK